MKVIALQRKLLHSNSQQRWRTVQHYDFESMEAVKDAAMLLLCGLLPMELRIIEDATCSVIVEWDADHGWCQV